MYIKDWGILLFPVVFFLFLFFFAWFKCAVVSTHHPSEVQLFPDARVQDVREAFKSQPM